jgi:hypothetical protein
LYLLSIPKKFEVNEEDYFSAEEEKQEDAKTNTNSKDSSVTTTNSEDTDKETCLDSNRIESAVVLSSASNLNSDSNLSDFHFVKKFDKDGKLIDSWDTVDQRMVKFFTLME